MVEMFARVPHVLVACNQEYVLFHGERANEFPCPSVTDADMYLQTPSGVRVYTSPLVHVNSCQHWLAMSVNR